jgi:hypothetical protein
MKKKLKIAGNTVLALLACASYAAKIKKDMKTHREHDRHNPCECGESCYGCLFSG